MEGATPTNLQDQDSQSIRSVAAPFLRIGCDLDEMYAKNENSAFGYSWKTAPSFVLISAMFLGTLSVSSPYEFLAEVYTFADGEKQKD